MSINIEKIAVIGVGTMGAGIAQIAIQSGHEVWLYDAKDGAAQAAQAKLQLTLNQLADKGKFSHAQAEQDLARLHIAERLEDLAECDLVVEAIIEQLEIKQNLMQQLESVLKPDAIIASNTSSLSITAIASTCQQPERIVGYHFFNPVPLMKVVEVIQGFYTRDDLVEALVALSHKMGHRPVVAKDTPGFIINHAGRAFGSEAYAILSEQVAPFYEIDRIYREGIGFKMGPFELGDLTGMDVSHPVSESIYQQYYHEPRYRPNINTRQRFIARQLGRKTGQGFYDYRSGQKQGDVLPQQLPRLSHYPSVWIGADFDQDRQALEQYLTAHNIKLDHERTPQAQSLVLLACYGEDATSAARRYGVDPRQVVCIDLLYGLNKHRTLMPSLITAPHLLEAAHSIFNLDGQSLSIINESVGFVAQRVMAMIVNLGCDIAQQNIASVDDINAAVRLGLGYPHGPIEWGDVLGADKILTILQRMSEITHDPRYRPSPWLRRRVELGLKLVHQTHQQQEQAA